MIRLRATPQNTVVNIRASNSRPLGLIQEAQVVAQGVGLMTNPWWILD